MKILKITTAIVLFTITVNAQITKGNWMVGGAAAFGTSSNETTSKNGDIINKDSSTSLSVSPNVGYFVINNFACGLSGSFGVYFPQEGNNITSYAIGPFIRYYFLKPEKRINILSQVAYYYGGDDSGSSNSKRYKFRAGPVFYFNKNVGLEVALEYNLSKFSGQSSNTLSNNFNVNFGFQIHLKK